MAHKERPRSWLTLDVDYFAQDSICELGDEFGPAGPVTFLVILTEAKRAALGGLPVTKQGRVSLRYRAVARTAFLGKDVELVRQIVEACVAMGLLELINTDETRFEVRLAKWKSWETTDSGAAERQRRSRAKQSDSPGRPAEQQGEDQYLPF